MQFGEKMWRETALPYALHSSMVKVFQVFSIHTGLQK